MDFVKFYFVEKKTPIWPFVITLVVNTVLLIVGGHEEIEKHVYKFTMDDGREYTVRTGPIVVTVVAWTLFVIAYYICVVLYYRAGVENEKVDRCCDFFGRRCVPVLWVVVGILSFVAFFQNCQFATPACYKFYTPYYAFVIGYTHLSVVLLCVLGMCWCAGRVGVHQEAQTEVVV
jgi:hypothetical protein